MPPAQGKNDYFWVASYQLHPPRPLLSRPFLRIETIDVPASRAALFADMVHAAWRFYDWTDLTR